MGLQSYVWQGGVASIACGKLCARRREPPASERARRWVWRPVGQVLRVCWISASKDAWVGCRRVACMAAVVAWRLPPPALGRAHRPRHAVGHWCDDGSDWLHLQTAYMCCTSAGCCNGVPALPRLDERAGHANERHLPIDRARPNTPASELVAVGASTALGPLSFQPRGDHADLAPVISHTRGTGAGVSGSQPGARLGASPLGLGLASRERRRAALQPEATLALPSRHPAYQPGRSLLHGAPSPQCLTAIAGPPKQVRFAFFSPGTTPLLPL